MLEEGGEVADNADERPIEIVEKKKSNAAEEEIETGTNGSGIDESKAAVLAATTDTPDKPEATDLTAHDVTEDHATYTGCQQPVQSSQIVPSTILSGAKHPVRLRQVIDPFKYKPCAISDHRDLGNPDETPALDEDAKEIPRVGKQIKTEVEFEKSGDARESQT